MKIVITYETQDEGLIYQYRDPSKRENFVIPALIKQLRLTEDEAASVTAEGVE